MNATEMNKYFNVTTFIAQTHMYIYLYNSDLVVNVHHIIITVLVK